MRRNGSLFWATDVVYTARVNRREHLLSVTVAELGDGQWYAIALEIGKNVAESKSVDAVLENHAHRNLGLFLTKEEAQAAAESFAKRWCKKKSTEPACTCADIAR